jgi:hypothetical protein
MNKIVFGTPALTIVALFVYLGLAGSASGAPTKGTINVQTRAVVSATTAFLNSLSAEKRNKVQFPFIRRKRLPPLVLREA